ncbi:MAG: multidrug ABC transporter ATP-binding protein, partial [Betaproteobacteria bacterium]|nr:multidrug ABC transporter ATP-binding protein [Betaproteobacteria bacterium]
MFRFFESRINPYPSEQPKPPPIRFLGFLWEVSAGVRGYIAAVTILTAAIGAFEAVLFALIGELVDWLSMGP